MKHPSKEIQENQKKILSKLPEEQREENHSLGFKIALFHSKGK